MKTKNVTDLIIAAVNTATGPVKAKIITRTEVKMNKRDVETKSIQNPYLGTVKVTTQIVELNPQYEKSVNEQRSLEGLEADFEASARKWGTNLGKGLIENGGKLYVGFIPVQHVLTNYLHGDKIIDRSELDQFIPKKKESSNQGVEKSIQYRTVLVENLIGFELV